MPYNPKIYEKDGEKNKDAFESNLPLLKHLLKHEDTTNIILESNNPYIIHNYTSKFENHPRIEELTDAFLSSITLKSYYEKLEKILCDFANIKGVNADKIANFIKDTDSLQYYTKAYMDITSRYLEK